MTFVLPAADIQAWDRYTIEHGNISSYDLMERAAKACSRELMRRWKNETPFVILCGRGNNGGDGLAIARHLLEQAYHVTVYTESSGDRSEDNAKNLRELEYLYPPCLHELSSELPWPAGCVVVDALLGTGLQRPLEGPYAELVHSINHSNHPVVSIDLPSGMHADKDMGEAPVVQATLTLSFQCFKPAFMLPESGAAAGEIQILDIGLHPAYPSTLSAPDRVIDQDLVRALYQPRKPFTHKGHYGHALLFCGSRGKMGAALLAARACLRSGVGLLTLSIPETENKIVQSGAPEAMSIPYAETDALPRLDSYQAIGAGSGLGMSEGSAGRLNQLLNDSSIPLVLDADALNLIAQQADWLKRIPAGSLLTPHPKEFDRLFDEHAHSAQRLQTQRDKAQELGLYIILKGRYSSLCTPQGETFFSVLGNAGMATGGSGDVLTGILTGLFAQYRDMQTAALLGLWLHGSSGDLTLRTQSMESLTAMDLAEGLGSAFKVLEQEG